MHHVSKSVLLLFFNNFDKCEPIFIVFPPLIQNGTAILAGIELPLPLKSVAEIPCKK